MRLVLSIGLAVFLPGSLMAASLVWTGSSGSTWDTASTPNWSNGGATDVFAVGDDVTFDDTAVTGNVSLSGMLDPGSVTVNNGNISYTFSGSGQIAGSTGLLKTGTGTLTISSTNSYSGGTVISEGTIIVTNTSALGSGTTTLSDVNTGGNSVSLLLNVPSSSATTFSRPIVASSVGSGTITIGRTGAGSGGAAISSALFLNNNVTFETSTSGTLSLTGSFTGSGNATVSGGGIASMTGLTGTSAASRWSGNLSITNDSLVLPNSVASLTGVMNNRNVNVAAGSGLAFQSGTVGMLTGAGYVGGVSGTSVARIVVGGSNASSTFDGIIGSATVAGYALSQTAGLIKTGTGVFTLTNGGNNYTGTTTVSKGTLALTGMGAIGSTPSIIISSGGTFDVSGLTSGAFTLGSSQTLLAGRTSNIATDVVGNIVSNGTLNIAGTGTAGTLSIGNNLTLSGGSLLFDFANVTTSGSNVNDLIDLGGNLALTGTVTVTPHLINGSLADGTYTLISGGAGLTSGNASDFAWGGSLNRQAVTFDTTTTPGSVLMTVSGTSANLIWLGNNGSTWDTGSTVNWNNGGTPDVFLGNDHVTFDDSSSNGTVTLSGTVQPGSLTVNNANTAYSFGGPGQIGGFTGLLKSGTGILTISNTNSYTGGTVISAGAIVVSNSAALGSSGTTTLGDANTGANNVALLFSVTSGSTSFSQPIVVSNQGGGTNTIGLTSTGNGGVTISSPLTLNNNIIFQSSSSGMLNIAGVLSGNGNITVGGGGITSLAATGTSTQWTGNASVTGSSLLLSTGSPPARTPLSSRFVTVAAGSGLAMASGTLGGLSGAGSVGGAIVTGTAANPILGIGGGNASSTFDGTIGGGTVAGYALNQGVSLVKTGTGVFTLTNSGNNYTGTTTVSQGTLALSGNGVIGSTPSITVAPGGVLDVSGLTSGTFTLGSSQTLQAGRTSSFATDIAGNVINNGTLNIAGSGTAGTLTVSGNLTLGGGSLVFDLANVTTAGSHVNDLIDIGGNLALTGTTTIAANLLGASLANGTYTLISGGLGLTSGNASDFAWGGVLNRQTISFDTTSIPGSVFMTVSGTAANLVWLGTNGNSWDADNTVNWNNNGTPDVFLQGDNVAFDDTSSNGTVTLSGTLQAGSLTVNNGNTTYSFGGAGRIAGSTGLLKSGTGTLTISNTNSYSGGTVVSAGTIVVSNSAALGASGTTTLGNANTGGNDVALLLSVSSSGATSFSRPVVVSNQGSGTDTIGRTGAGSGTATINSPLTLNKNLTIESSANGPLSVTGSFIGSGNVTFTGGGITSLADTTGTSSPWSGTVSVTGNSLLLASSNLSPSSVLTRRAVNVAAGSGLAMASGTLGALTGAGYLGGAIATGSANNPVVGIGGGNASSTFDGTIGGGTVAGYALNQAVSIVKTGTGVFTLTNGGNNYTGTTTITQGTLALSGSGGIGSTPSITVAPGAEFDVSGLSSGTFTLGSSQTLQAGRTSGFAPDIIGSLASSGNLNVVGSGTAGTMTIGNNLTLDNSSLYFDLANVTTAGAHVNDLITLGGDLSLNGTTVLVPNLVNNALASGTYTLISGGSSLTGGNASNLAWGGPVVRQTVNFDTTTTPGTVYMTVTGSSAVLFWSGSNGNVWNSSNVSWINETTMSGSSDKFYALDDVNFTDAAASGNVTLSGTLEPGAVTVDNASTAYTFGGSGQIAGTASLIKSGSGTLTLATANSYTGPTTVDAGTLSVTNSNALIDSSSIVVTSSAALNASSLRSLTVGSTQTLTNQGVVSGNLALNGTLAGTGIVTGSVDALAGSTVAPGDTGIMTVQNGFNLGLGAHLSMEIGGTNAGFGTNGVDGYDQLVVSGSGFSLAGDLQISFINPAFSLKTASDEAGLAGADYFVLIVDDTGSPVDGMFSNATFTDPNFPDYPNDAMDVGGQEFLLLYNTNQSGAAGQGNDVTAFAVVPEPGELWMLVAGIGVVGGGGGRAGARAVSG